MSALDLSATLTQNTSEEERQALRKRCRESLYFLCKAVLGFRDFTPHLHLRAAAFVDGQGPRRKLLMLPRGFMKSHLATIGYPIWLTIQEPNPAKNFRGPEERILIANATAENAQHFLLKIKSIYERNMTFQWLFPELIPDFSSKDIKWNVTEASVPRKVEYPEPTFSAAGAGAAIVSRHFTRIILDDLINEQHAISPDLMRKVIDWYTYTESLLEIPSRDELIVIGTRWAFNDLYSHIQETEGEYSAETPLGYAQHIRHAIEEDKAIFPERFPLRELMRLRLKLADYMFSCLYLNNPRQPGVNDFNKEWLQYYSLTEKNHVKLSDGRVLDPNDFDRVAILDIATSTRKDADFSSCVVVGVDALRRVFLLEAWHGRVTTKHLIDQALKLAHRWHVRCLFYEEDAQQKLLEWPLKERVRESGKYLRIEGVKVGNKQSKEMRVRAVASYFQQNRVYVRPSMEDFLKEYDDFPLGKHDDIIDAFAKFPRCVRWQYDDVEDADAERDKPDKYDNPEDRVYESFSMSGRSSITGY